GGGIGALGVMLAKDDGVRGSVRYVRKPRRAVRGITLAVACPACSGLRVVDAILLAEDQRVEAVGADTPSRAFERQRAGGCRGVPRTDQQLDGALVGVVEARERRVGQRHPRNRERAERRVVDGLLFDELQKMKDTVAKPAAGGCGAPWKKAERGREPFE